MKLDVWFNFSIRQYYMGDLFIPDPLEFFILIGPEYTLEIENNTKQRGSLKESLNESDNEVIVELTSPYTTYKIVIDGIITDYDEEEDNKLSVRLKVSAVKLCKWFEVIF